MEKKEKKLKNRKLNYQPFFIKIFFYIQIFYLKKVIFYFKDNVIVIYLDVA